MRLCLHWLMLRTCSVICTPQLPSTAAGMLWQTTGGKRGGVCLSVLGCIAMVGCEEWMCTGGAMAALICTCSSRPLSASNNHHPQMTQRRRQGG